MIEYDSGSTTHEHQEDFSVIIYLNDCEDGNTIFILNQDRDVRVTHKPIKGQGTIFLSNIALTARVTSESSFVDSHFMGA